MVDRGQLCSGKPRGRAGVGPKVGGETDHAINHDKLAMELRHEVTNDRGNLGGRWQR